MYTETELRWLKAVERERLYKNSYPWVPKEDFSRLNTRSCTPPQLDINTSYTNHNSAFLEKTVCTDTTQKFDMPTQTLPDPDQKSPTFKSLNAKFHSNSNLSPSEASEVSPWQASSKWPEKKISERSLKQSALSVHSILDSQSISKSSLRDKSEIMQAVYNLLENLEKSEGSVESVLSKYSGRARKVCEVVLEHINKETNFDYEGQDPLGKVVELSRIQEVPSESSIGSKGLTAMLGEVLKEIIQVKEDVKLLHSS